MSAYVSCEYIANIQCRLNFDRVRIYRTIFAFNRTDERHTIGSAILVIAACIPSMEG